MSRLCALAVVVSLVGVVGCAIFQLDREDLEPVVDPADSPEDHVAETFEELERLRGQQMDQYPKIRQGKPADFDREPVPEEVVAEWEWFEEILFGGRVAPLKGDDRRWAGRVGFDQEDDALVFDGDPRIEESAAFAVAMAAGMAMERAGFDELEGDDSVDGWLTAKIVERAGPAFAAAVLLARQFDEELDVDELADRPGLAAHLPGIGDELALLGEYDDITGVAEPPEGTDYFQEALTQFVLRKAISMGAALYRGAGWPGVEWGRSEPPENSDALVRPQSWFEGEGPAEWDWPQQLEEQKTDEDWSRRREGRVGPAVTALWLEGLVGTTAARTIFGGWLDDAYRIYTRDDEGTEETAFDWVSAWRTPHDAQEVASAMEAALGHYLGHEHRQQRYRVATAGVVVAVSIYDRDQPAETVNQRVEMLTEASPGFLHAEPAPFDYEPPLYERYVDATTEAVLDLDAHRWRDSAAGWQTRLDSLDGWRLQRADEAHVRWFGNHPDGTLIQWTTELVDPNDPPFGSDAYLDHLAARFTRSVETEQPPRVELTDRPVDETVQLQVTGQFDGRNQVIQLWQWKRGDVLVSFSVQGPEGRFGERLDEAEAVLSQIEPYGEAIEQREITPDADPADDEGIIEFEIGAE